MARRVLPRTLVARVLKLSLRVPNSGLIPAAGAQSPCSHFPFKVSTLVLTSSQEGAFQPGATPFGHFHCTDVEASQGCLIWTPDPRGE